MSFIKKAAQGNKNPGGMIEKRILLLGLDNAGKSSILNQVKNKEFKETTPTIGLNIENITYKRYDITFWDVGGQATKLWKHYFDSIDTIIFVIDSADKDKIMFARDEIQKLETDQDLAHVPFMIMYNKADLGPQCMSKEEIDSRISLPQIVEARPADSATCSAMTGEGVWEALDRIVAYFEQEHGFCSDDTAKKQTPVFEKGNTQASASTAEGRKPTISSEGKQKQ